MNIGLRWKGVYTPLGGLSFCWELLTVNRVRLTVVCVFTRSAHFNFCRDKYVFHTRAHGVHGVYNVNRFMLQPSIYIYIYDPPDEHTFPVIARVFVYVTITKLRIDGYMVLHNILATIQCVYTYTDMCNARVSCVTYYALMTTQDVHAL